MRDEAMRRAVAASPGACHLCGDDQLRLEGERWCADHVVPQARGGKEEIDNMRKAHSTCNEWRGSRSLTSALQRGLALRRRLEIRLAYG